MAKVTGFSLHAGVSCEAHQVEKRERLCRYISDPAVFEFNYQADNLKCPLWFVQRTEVDVCCTSEVGRSRPFTASQIDTL